MRWNPAALLLPCLLTFGCQPGTPVAVAPSEHPATASYRVIGFFGGGPWRYQRLTHFIPGFLGFDGDGNLATWDLKEVVQDCHAVGVEVILSFDGEHWEENFLPMSDNADGSRDRFISNLKAFCLEQGIDGVDYDWEIGGGFSQQHQLLYSDLVVATKEALEPLGKTVSIDVYFRDELNAEGLAAVDWLQLMSYEGLVEMQNMVEYWESRGVPREKIVIGMAAGWGAHGEGFDVDLAAEKARYVTAHGYAGVMLFRTDLDPAREGSMLGTVHGILAPSK